MKILKKCFLCPDFSCLLRACIKLFDEDKFGKNKYIFSQIRINKNTIETSIMDSTSLMSSLPFSNVEIDNDSFKELNVNNYD